MIDEEAIRRLRRRDMIWNLAILSALFGGSFAVILTFWCCAK